MLPLTTHLLKDACRIFLAIAYPEGPDSIPDKKRAYHDLREEQPIDSVLPPATGASGVCQEIFKDTGEACGWEFRLGSSRFPHLKLRVQQVEHEGKPVWVFMVDTHDAFSKHSRFPPPDHPDAEKWLSLQCANRELKEQIEAAFEQHGLNTVNAILRGALKPH